MQHIKKLCIRLLEKTDEIYICDCDLVFALQDEVLIAGFGRRGHAVGDIPGVRFKVLLSSDKCSPYI